MKGQKRLRKSMRMKNNLQGDDLFLDRLFSYLNDRFSFNIQYITPVKNRVFKIHSSEKVFILKGFHSYHRLKLQEAFSYSLQNEGFKHTYSFLKFGEEMLFFEGTYYGCLEYIEPAKTPFSYKTDSERLEGLELLERYHLATSRLVRRYNTLLSTFRILKKWRERTARFMRNISVKKFFIQKEMIDELLRWADWSLKGMEKEIPLIEKKADVILHGDVAHHNFLRAQDNRLYLIDYDLISIGPPMWDYLQYANRILPFLHWSLAELANFKKFSSLLEENVFLFALAYPSDIFREWNRAIREHFFTKAEKLRPVLDLTVNQFSERQRFFRELQNMINAR